MAQNILTNLNNLGTFSALM